jgi:hypothetical protein
LIVLVGLAVIFKGKEEPRRDAMLGMMAVAVEWWMVDGIFPHPFEPRPSHCSSLQPIGPLNEERFVVPIGDRGDGARGRLSGGSEEKKIGTAESKRKRDRDGMSVFFFPPKRCLCLCWVAL